MSDQITLPKLADHSGICPLCSSFIAKHRSWVVALPKAMIPRGDGRCSSDDGGYYYYYDGRRIPMFPRKWAHERCARRYAKQQAKVVVQV